MARTDVESILKKAEALERKGGRLKIFLGMCAGVGKTYAMLEEAQKRTKEGFDIVVGSVNTHGRCDTAELLEGLEQIPEKEVEYKSIKTKELDLDALLARKPQIAIVDELAHSNPPSFRHPKRWQDILELLDAKIDVYTTLNIQHLESFRDIIEEIIGAPVQGDVPDFPIDKAANIELIDLTPQELLQRLHEGKVYVGGFSQAALKHFFQENRLTALREIALRLTADKVDHELRLMVSSLTWKPRERLLTIIDHLPVSAKLIRTTRRLATHLDATWVALHINTGETLTSEESKALDKHLKLARSLGGEIFSLSDPNKYLAIQRVAEQHEITQIALFQGDKKLFPLLKRAGNVNLLLVPYPKAIKKPFPWLFSSLALLFVLSCVLFFFTPIGGYAALLVLIIAFFVAQMRLQRSLLIKQSEYSKTFHAILRSIATAPSTDQLLAEVKEKLSKLLGGSLSIMTPDSLRGLDEKEQAIALWSYKNGCEAGWSTNTLPQAKHLFTPIKSYGLLSYAPLLGQVLLSEEMTLLYTIADQLGLYLERKSSEESRLKTAQEETFLRLISQEFTSAMSQNVTTLKTLTSGLFTLSITPQNISHLVRATLDLLKEPLAHHHIKLTLPELPPIPFDFNLLQILLSNLLVNAATYAPLHTLIEIHAELSPTTLHLSVLDEGPGIPEHLFDLIFERFYRSSEASPGFGLGLPIAKLIAELHGGTLSVQNRSPHGAHFTLSLPYK